MRSAGDVVKPGQEVKVRVLEIDPEARRISLSIEARERDCRRPPHGRDAAAAAKPKKTEEAG